MALIKGQGRLMSFEDVSGRCLPRAVQAKLAKIHASVKLSKCSCARNVIASRKSLSIRWSSVMNIAGIYQQTVIKPAVTHSMTCVSSMMRWWASSRSTARTRSSVWMPTCSLLSDSTCWLLATVPMLISWHPQEVGEMGARNRGNGGSGDRAGWCLTFSSGPKKSRF